MVELAKWIIGTELIAYSDINAMRVNLPNEDNDLFDWHQCHPYVLDSLDGVVFWVPLQEVDQENGCLTLALGSHQVGLLKMSVSDHDNRANNRTRSLRIAYPSVAERFEKVQVPVRHGDALVFNTLLMHASGPTVHRARAARSNSAIEISCIRRPSRVAGQGHARSRRFPCNPEYVVERTQTNGGDNR